jgi:tRNA dimethylallyltransferase
VRAELDREPVESLVSELLDADPGAAGALDVDNPRRVVRAVEILRLTGATPSQRLQSEPAVAVRHYRSIFELVAYGVDPGRGLEERITDRTRRMREEGLLDEVSRLSRSLGRSASLAVGYRDLLEVVNGSVDVDEGFDRVRRSTLALAKRQRTFFARDQRIRWLPGDDRAGSVGTLVTALMEGAAG